MNTLRDPADIPRCQACGHDFTAAELAAITARAGREDLSIITCASCGAHNVARAQPQSGLDHHPAVEVLRIAKHDPATGEVFDETVEPGVRVHPVTSGESN